jgi:uncharacterized hydrophobic protein (TIGR00271 family)
MADRQDSKRILPHVRQEKLAALESNLETLSSLSRDFLIVLAASTVIATLGLFQNSPAVIIGAMIIAPLMRPLMGLSLATLTADVLLLRRALSTLVCGTLLAAIIAWALATILQSIEVTPEIMARTQPNLLDLGVAIFAGIVGAYCHTNEKLNDTLAGVAIAVALVPPLSVVGIGLAMQVPSIWTGAALLYATNLVGITVAGSLVFLLMGYTPLVLARKGLLVSSIALCLLIVPLGLSMNELVLENILSRKIRVILKEKTYTFRSARLRDIEVRRFERPMKVIATVFASGQQVTPGQVKLVQDFLIREIGIPLEFVLKVIPLTEVDACAEVIESTGSSSLQPIPSTSDAESITNQIPNKIPSEVHQITLPVDSEARDSSPIPPNQ